MAAALLLVYGKKTMSVFHKPKYPVVDPNPNMWKTIGNFNVTDVSHVLAFTGSGGLFGFFGSRMQLRGRNAAFLAGIGALAGVMYASQSSMQRLMGLEQNWTEVASYGAASAETMATYERKGPVPNIELIDSPPPK